ncbi:MAG: NADAR family protein [Fermentimonas sp.]|nr:NADAR family protein [Dysgonamonadaceae bacterium]MDD4697751.1 NADAR family protein [Fermentimonas sp.]
MEEKIIIHFYSLNKEFGEFSNFALYPVKLKGKEWPTSEHYFQAQKFEDQSYQKEIQRAHSPMKAAELGRSREVKIRRNRDKIKDNVMYEAVYAKFTQYPELQELLLSTEDAILVEHTSKDSYWGDGGDGSGKNMLGKILIKVREKLYIEEQGS